MIELTVLLSFTLIAFMLDNRRMVKQYNKLVSLKDRTIKLKDDSLARMDILANEQTRTIDYLLTHILKLNPDDEVAKDSLIKIRQIKEIITEVWAEKAKERFNNDQTP